MNLGKGGVRPYGSFFAARVCAGMAGPKERENLDSILLLQRDLGTRLLLPGAYRRIGSFE